MGNGKNRTTGFIWDLYSTPCPFKHKRVTFQENPDQGEGGSAPFSVVSNELAGR